jgi:hypothetical protein
MMPLPSVFLTRSEQFNTVSTDAKNYTHIKSHETVCLKYCLITNDPDFPITQLAGRLPCLGLCIEENRLLMLAEILETILDPDEEFKRVAAAAPRSGLKRTDSNSSFSSAVSSLTGSAAGSGSSYIGWKKNRAVPDSAVPALQPSANQSIASKNVVQLELSFAVDKLVLEIEREAAPVLKFQILDTSATIRMKSATLHGGFQIGACLCEHGRFRMPDGTPIRLLCTEGAAEVDKGHEITLKNKALVVPLTDEFRVVENIRVTDISLILNSHT